VPFEQGEGRPSLAWSLEGQSYSSMRVKRGKKKKKNFPFILRTNRGEKKEEEPKVLSRGYLEGTSRKEKRKERKKDCA